MSSDEKGVLLSDTIGPAAKRLKMERDVEVKKKLPLDLICEILSWCDVSALASHRLVCKEWLKLISKSQLIILHLQRFNTLRGFFLQFINCSTDRYHTSFVTPLQQKPALPLDFLPEHVIVEASTGNQGGHGLLCCSNHTSGANMRYYVCKPTTREWTPLPCPNSRTSTINMGMCIVTVANPPVFKIVRLSTRRKTNRCTGYKFDAYYTEVFDSVKWEWERVPSGAGFDFKRFTLTSDAALFINGSFYWFEFPSLIVCFDLETNEWSLVKLPEALLINNEAGSTSNVDLNLVNMNGNLALLVHANQSDNPQVDVWVMVDKVGQYWVKKESLKLEMEGEVSVLGFFASDVALVAQSKVTGLNNIYWYDTENNRWSDGDQKLRFIFIRIHSFQSDFIPCNIGERNVVNPP